VRGIGYECNSNAIEGNTLKLRQVKLVLTRGITIEGKMLRDHLKVINRGTAISLLGDFIAEKKNLSVKLALS
jgi:Fic family protein